MCYDLQLREHPEYKQFSQMEKTRVRNHSRTVLEKSEKLKLTLKARYLEEHEDWVAQEEERRARQEEEDRKRKVGTFINEIL